MECSKCHREGLTEKDFNRSRNKKSGYRGICKKCDRATQNQWRKNNPILQAEKCRKFQYGISREHQRDLWDRQGGKCLICGKGMDYRKANLDHNHKTHKVRGFLCAMCNKGIGHMEEDPKRTRRAAAYIHIFNSDHPDPFQVMLNIRDRNYT